MTIDRRWPTLLWLFLIAGSALAPVAAIQPDDPSASKELSDDVLAPAIACTVCVFPPDGQGGGSGVLIDADGFALTNYHVVQPCGPYLRCGLSDGQLYDAVLVGIDPTGDVAVIKLLGRNDFPHATFGDSDTVRAGEPCFVLGNPFLLATDFQPTLSTGIISAVQRYQYPSGTLLEYADCIQTDAAINPGNSGGPLFNAQGQLIGINGRCSFEKRGRINVGVGYAISINQIKLFLSGLAAGRFVDHASIGATVASDRQGRVVIDQILEFSDAYRRGLRYGDEIVEFAGREVRTVNQFKNALGTLPANWLTTMSYLRDGQRNTVAVRVPPLHADAELQELMATQLPQPGDSTLDPSTTEIPAAVAEVFRPGPNLVNAHFNAEQIQQLLSEQDWHDLPGKDRAWQLNGVAENQTKIQLILGDAQSGLAWGEEKEVIDLTGGGGDLLNDIESLRSKRGLLLACHCYRQFLVSAAESSTSLVYAGAFPWPKPQDLWHPTIITRWHGVDCEFYFHPESRQLSGVQVFFDSASDPWCLRIVESTGGSPNRIEAWTGDRPPHTIQFQSVEFQQ